MLLGSGSAGEPAAKAEDKDVSGAEPAPKANPAAKLKIAEKKVLWQSGADTGQSGRARFSPDGKRLAWLLYGEAKPAAEPKPAADPKDPGDPKPAAEPKTPPAPAVPAKGAGQILVAEVETGKASAVWEPAGAGRVHDLAWSPAGDLAGCVQWGKRGEEKSGSGVVLLPAGGEKAKLLPGTEGAKALAWRADSKALAYAADDALFLYDLAAGKAVKLLDGTKGWRPKGAPAFDDLVFCGERLAAREAGSARWWLGAGGQKWQPLGEFRAVAPAPDGQRLYAVPWLVGPAKIPRGAGVAWLNPGEQEPKPQVIVPDRPADGGSKPYWLVDVWDWHYFSTLRVSADGKSLTFCGAKAGELSPNAWREFCVWQVPADGSAPPKALCELGPIFKRIDASGRDWAIGWRYDLDRATVLVDTVRGRAWRIPEEAGAMREQSDVCLDKLLVATAAGNAVNLVRLEEVK
jgi:hypothetical protein